jgi:hypothetical protein
MVAFKAASRHCSIGCFCIEAKLLSQPVMFQDSFTVLPPDLPHKFPSHFLFHILSVILGPVILLGKMSTPALTTAFIPSPSCLSDLYFYQPTNFYISLGPPSTSDCLPSGWALSGYFSPGICPSGYTIACSSSNSLDLLTETVATCCPS